MGDTPDSSAPTPTSLLLPGLARIGSVKSFSWRNKIDTIPKVIQLTFQSDHQLITNNVTGDALKGWSNTGSKFPKPEYTYGVASKPVSVYGGRKLLVDVQFEVNYPNADEQDADVTGTIGSVTFTAPAQKFKGGTVPVTAETSAVLPDQVQKIAGDIAWKVVTAKDGTFNPSPSWGHAIYTTLGIPTVAPGREAGITFQRMDRSVTLVAAAGSTDSHVIAKSIQDNFKTYTLTPDPAVPAVFNHPTYMADTSAGQTESGCGAWPLADFIPQTAECQAIIRFMRAVMLQVGVPGSMSIVVVYADPFVGAAVQEKDWDAGASGLNGVTKEVSGKTWGASMVDTDPVKVGQLFDPNAIGLNNYEACLKLIYGGKTMYYGGGAGDYTTADGPAGVISCFYALCWTSTITLKDGSTKVRIEEIVKRFR